jgi:hypothetical protein
MQLTRECELDASNIMINNLGIINNNKYLNKEKKAEILHTSFWNHLLRFIVINGKEYPTNSKIHLSGELFLRYTNPHEEDIRISYDHKKQILFAEKMELVPHPFTYMQRISRDAMVGIMMHGYEACGYTNPNEKIREWKKADPEIAIGKIKSLEIESFYDRPKAIWNNRDDYTAYKIFITTK